VTGFVFLANSAAGKTELPNSDKLKNFVPHCPRGSSLCEGMGEGCCTQPYPCICKEAVSGFEPMTNKSPRHNFTAAPGLALKRGKYFNEMNE